ncbi:hypothetical protein CYLTODRAFT_460647 [Cylindrobasidium torrendii FP15055 ss-10]|uniref:Uncharacterized protein n=1 Tax=Cylindrobasidium torrendii FP15055 ss-10 TaxID=1314674 RepID=A0A0D7ATG2_9AGAR|nr:hypothetical protein CYLTODRAFT_460647 [Cylindrobasidium torrendii FP15055 ss-10]
MAELLEDSKARDPPAQGVIEHIRIIRAPFRTGQSVTFGSEAMDITIYPFPEGMLFLVKQ